MNYDELNGFTGSLTTVYDVLFFLPCRKRRREAMAHWPLT